jgi:hypothetical protein
MSANLCPLKLIFIPIPHSFKQVQGPSPVFHHRAPIEARYTGVLAPVLTPGDVINGLSGLALHQPQAWSNLSSHAPHPADCLACDHIRPISTYINQLDRSIHPYSCPPSSSFIHPLDITHLNITPSITSTRPQYDSRHVPQQL